MDKKPNNTEADIDMDKIEKNLEQIWEREVRDYIEDDEIQEIHQPEAAPKENREETHPISKNNKHIKREEISTKKQGVQVRPVQFKEDKTKAAEKKLSKREDKAKAAKKKALKREDKAKAAEKKLSKREDKAKAAKKKALKREDKAKSVEKKELKKLKKEQKSGGKRFLSMLLVLLILLAAAWYLLVSGVYGKMEYKPIDNFTNEPLKAEGVVNVLLIGTDARTMEEEGRSDAMILLSISQKTKSFHMTSLLRDMYVEIPGHDGNRLNAAYSFGGPELLMATVEQNFEIEVNRYAVVNFEAFANLVDAVEGIDLELSNEEVQWVNAYLNEYNMLRGMPIETDYLDTSLSGIVHLNGPQALAYSRNRYIGTDFGRTERQRKVLSEVIRKLPVGMMKNPIELTNGLFTNLTTNLTKNECLQMSLMGGSMLTYDIIQGSIPIEGSYKDAKIREMAVLEVDFEQNKQYIRKEIYGEK